MPNFAFSPATHRNLTTVRFTPQNRTYSGGYWTLATPGGVSASNVRVPLEQLMFSAEQQTAVINAWGGRAHNEVPTGRFTMDFSLTMFQYDDGYDPSPLQYLNYNYGYAKWEWSTKSTGSSSIYIKHTLYTGVKKVSETYAGDGGQSVTFNAFTVDLQDTNGAQTFYTRVQDTGDFS